MSTFTILKASHLMGGDIWVEIDSNGNHILKHVNFRDTLGIPAYAQTDFKAFKYDSITNVWNAVTAPSSMALNMPMDSSNSNWLLTGVPYGVEMFNYKSEAGLLDSIFAANGNGRYRFYTDECCRNAAILNITQHTSMIIHCEYSYSNTVVNESPVFLAIPIFYGPINTPWVYNPLPFDPDGDSLVWSVNTPICTANAANGNYTNCGGYTVPPSTTGPFTLNNASGQLDWTPNTLGNYVASFIITEYRNGIEIGNTIRDMQYIVVTDSCRVGRRCFMPEFVAESSFNTESAQQYNYYYYQPGQAVNFKIGADDANTTDVLTMQAFSELLLGNNPSASFNYFAAASTGNKVIGEFLWTPAITDTKDFTLVVRANDGLFSKDFTVIFRKGLSPQSVDDFKNGELDIAIYPNPARVNELISFDITSRLALANLQLQVIDLSGKIIVKQNVGQLSNGHNTMQLNKNLQAGFYMANIIDLNSGKRKLIKFVVQ